MQAILNAKIRAKRLDCKACTCMGTDLEVPPQG